MALLACGGGNNVSAPSRVVGPPSVAGNYSGTTTVSATSIGQSFSCATTTSVVQNGYAVSIAPLILSGGNFCNGASIPFGDATIDANGSLGSQSTTLNISGCTYAAVGSGGFFGSQLRGSFTYTGQSSACPSFFVTITLTRG